MWRINAQLSGLRSDWDKHALERPSTKPLSRSGIAAIELVAVFDCGGGGGGCFDYWLVAVVFEGGVYRATVRLINTLLFHR